MTRLCHTLLPDQNHKYLQHKPHALIYLIQPVPNSHLWRLILAHCWVWLRLRHNLFVPACCASGVQQGQRCGPKAHELLLGRGGCERHMCSMMCSITWQILSLFTEVLVFVTVVLVIVTEVPVGILGLGEWECGCTDV